MPGNSGSGDLKPSVRDKDITDRLIQCGRIIHVQVLDHLIITDKTYFSFADSGLREELGQSKKYVPEYKVREGIKKQVEKEAIQKGEKQKAMTMAKLMKTKGYSSEEIAKTGQPTGGTV